MSELYLLDITQRLNDPVEEYLPRFSPERQAAILRYRFPSDRNRTLWAELLARWLIRERLGREPVIQRDERGKPYADGAEFNLSHSGPWVACSLGKSGVDVEVGQRLDLNVAKRFFRPEEYRRLKGLADRGADWENLFLRYWTLKESYLKYTGQGLAGGLERVDCEALWGGGGEAAGRNFVLPDGAVVGICAPPGELPERVRRVQFFRGEGFFMAGDLRE